MTSSAPHRDTAAARAAGAPSEALVPTAPTVQPVRDTIVAAATPPGRGGVGIVRVSGSLVPQIAATLLGAVPLPRFATYGSFLAADGQGIDSGLALYFPAPHSYTAEHVLELHGHGGPVIIEALIRRVTALGARRALPGEFTQRAYLHGKLDLAQAEAVADLINAGSEAAARAAGRSLQGEFSARVHELVESIGELRAWVEAAIDFAEEQIDFLSDRAMRTRLVAVRQQFAALGRVTRQGRLLMEGYAVVIAGRPNVGKSTLLNRLAGHEAAIVTPIAGTTRDVLHEHIDLDGLPLHIIDTAGLRAGGDAIEAEGIRRAEAEMARADRVLFVVDAADDPRGAALAEQRARLPNGVPVTLVFNKTDLSGASPPDAEGPADAVDLLRISAKTGQGLEALKGHLKHCAGFQGSEGGTISARARHVEALGRAQGHMEAAVGQLEQAGGCELVAEELRLAQLALGTITGESGSEELLGRIFASFCIGK